MIYLEGEHSIQLHLALLLVYWFINDMHGVVVLLHHFALLR